MGLVPTSHRVTQSTFNAILNAPKKSNWVTNTNLFLNAVQSELHLAFSNVMLTNIFYLFLLILQSDILRGLLCIFNL